MEQKIIRITLRLILYVILTLGVVIMVFPYLYMLSTSFKSSHEIVNNVAYFYLIPKELTFSNYKQIFKIIPLLNGFKNTLIIEFFVIIVGTFTTTLAAFSFAKLKFPGKNFIFMMLLSGMMIPYVALMTPQYAAFTKLGMVDTLLPLILPGLFGNTAMMFFLRQYARSIPDTIFEAAKIDGASYFRQYWNIFIPTAAPAIAAHVIFWFLGIWNDVLAPDIYLTTLENKTIQVMLQYLNTQTGSGTIKNLPLIMAGSVLSSIPILALYISFQKYFVNTLALSGIVE